VTHTTDSTATPERPDHASSNGAGAGATDEPRSTKDRRSGKGDDKRKRRLSRAWTTRVVRAVTVLSAVAAAFAPASLTGQPMVDIAERALFAALVTYTTAHGRRWSWFVGAGILLVPARGVSLALVVAATLVAMWATTHTHRPRHLGALVGAFLANAALWLPASLPLPIVATCAVVASGVLVVSGIRAMRRRPRRTVLVPLLVVSAAALLAVIGVGVGAALTVADLSEGTSAARSALVSVENGDTETARIQLESAQTHLDRAHAVLGPSTAAARLIPSLAQHVTALEVAVAESRKITSAADDLLASADYENLRYQGRVDLAQVRMLAPGAADVRDVLADAEVELDAARSPWLASPLQARIDEFHDEVAEVREASDLASEVLDLTPGLFGGDGERRYLIVFLTPAELRGGGGFVGSYAELLATNGGVELARSGPIRELIAHESFGERTISGPEEYLDRYGRFNTANYIQDVTYSPHFPHNAEVLAEIYPQAGGTRVDGVIGVDPAGLAALLELTGPVQVEGYGKELSAENAEEFLLRGQYLEFSDYEDLGEAATKDQRQEERRDFLAEATRATFAELTRASLPAPAEIGRVLGPAARGRHLQVWSTRKAERALFERVGADGALEIPLGHDGFEVAQHNAGNNKIDAYLHRVIDYRAQVDPDTGRLEATMRIELENRVGRRRLPSAVIGNRSGIPGHTNITWLSIFTPHRVVEATVDGERVTLGEELEVGLYAYDTPFIYIPADETVVVELRLEGAVDLSEGYNLRVVPQPVANPDRVVAEVTSTGRGFRGPDADGGAVTVDTPMTEPIERSAEFE
jgi:hypothetical protein